METEDLLGVLGRTDPFALLERDILSPFCRGITVNTFKKGAYIFRQGEPSCDCLFVIARGLVEILVEDDCRAESVVGLRRAYDFFGETVVLSGQRYPGSARAKQASTCLCLYRKDLESLIYGHPEFSGFFNTLLAERMRLIYERNLSDRSCTIPRSNPALLFRKQVSRVMSTPVLTCREDDPVCNAARQMIKRQVGCLVVVDSAGRFLGVLTERHLVAGLVAEQTCPVDRCTAARLMDSRPVSIAPEAYLDEALAAMIRNRTRQLVVMERDLPVGVVAFSDLVRSPSADSLMLIHEIADQNSLDGLAALSAGIDRVLDALVAERAGVQETMEIMSRLNNRITRKVIALCEVQMKTDGWGPPPVDYCWINMGSAARHEQTLRTDQDNAIIYGDPEGSDAQATVDYFRRLAELAVDGLVRCGFERCSGGVMATNPQWCRSISEWRHKVAGWMTSVDPEDIRTLTILLDFRSVWGNTSLADTLWADIVAAFSGSMSAGHMLSRDDQKLVSPIGFLGNILTERSGPKKGRLNLKTAALVHMVNAVRLLALRRGIATPSTLERLDQLVVSQALSAEDAAFYRAGFETLMLFRIREHRKRVRDGHPPENTLDPKALDRNETLLLKDALSAVAQLQKRISKGFHVPWMNYFGQ